VPLSNMKASWVDGARVLYNGKAENLDKWLRCMAAVGASRRAAHPGGGWSGS
jgi:hypothetical protein